MTLNSSVVRVRSLSRKTDRVIDRETVVPLKNVPAAAQDDIGKSTPGAKIKQVPRVKSEPN
jgi:hypothetical protein